MSRRKNGRGVWRPRVSTHGCCCCLNLQLFQIVSSWIRESNQVDLLFCAVYSRSEQPHVVVMPARLGNVDSYLCGPLCVSWVIQSCWGKDLWWKIAPPFETAPPSFLLSFFVWFLFLDQTIRRDSRCVNRIQLLVREEEQEQRQNSSIYGRRLKTTYNSNSGLGGHLFCPLRSPVFMCTLTNINKKIKLNCKNLS